MERGRPIRSTRLKDDLLVRVVVRLIGTAHSHRPVGIVPPCRPSILADLRGGLRTASEVPGMSATPFSGREGAERPAGRPWIRDRGESPLLLIPSGRDCPAQWP